ncbi:hypothetical protein BV25DRAFT_373037 [Artomyces pyxidatus]|uniref:Uncharacterized protein n=1 Tax=Artomyces pyxidatus TaxID=48021 RepID=A0ACB8T621_9AGAM|nr:hypothetical protein BV25DRAFT_373037 [Artomyces pyxidatus]
MNSVPILRPGRRPQQASDCASFDVKGAFDLPGILPLYVLPIVVFSSHFQSTPATEHLRAPKITAGVPSAAVRLRHSPAALVESFFVYMARKWPVVVYPRAPDGRLAPAALTRRVCRILGPRSPRHRVFPTTRTRCGVPFARARANSVSARTSQRTRPSAHDVTRPSLPDCPEPTDRSPSLRAAIGCLHYVGKIERGTETIVIMEVLWRCCTTGLRFFRLLEYRTSREAQHDEVTDRRRSLSSESALTSVYVVFRGYAVC